MKSRTSLFLAGLWFGLFSVSCEKKESPAPSETKPHPVAKVDVPQVHSAELPKAPPAKAPVEEDKPDEEEPASGDGELPAPK